MAEDSPDSNSETQGPLSHKNEDQVNLKPTAAQKGTGVFLPRTSKTSHAGHPPPPPPPPAAAAAADSEIVLHHSSRHTVPSSSYTLQPPMSSSSGFWRGSSSNNRSCSSDTASVTASAGFNRHSSSGTGDALMPPPPPPPPPPPAPSRQQQQQQYGIGGTNLLPLPIQQQQQHLPASDGCSSSNSAGMAMQQQQQLLLRPPHWGDLGSSPTSIIPWMRATSSPGAVAEHTTALAAAIAALHSELRAADHNNSLMQQQQQHQQVGVGAQLQQRSGVASDVVLSQAGTAGLRQWPSGQSAAMVHAGSSNTTGTYPDEVAEVCRPMFSSPNTQHQQDALALLVQQQQQQQHVSQTVLGSSPQQHTGMLNMVAARQLPGVKLISTTPFELEELLSCELSSSSTLLPMPAKRMSSQLLQQQQQLMMSGSFLPSTAMPSGGGSNGYSSSCAPRGPSRSSSPFLAEACQQGQLQLEQQQRHMPEQYSGSLVGSMGTMGAMHAEFALAPRTHGSAADGDLMGQLTMPRVLNSNSSSSTRNAALQQWHYLASSQLLSGQQQYQQGQGSSPLPGMDPALADVQRQLAAVSLTADMPFAPAAAAGSSGSRMPSLLQSLCSSTSNSEGLAGTSPPAHDSSLRTVIDEEIVRLLKLRERLTVTSALAPDSSPVAAPCSAAARTHEDAMKQALAARAALQVASLAFDAAAAGSSNSAALMSMTDVSANAASGLVDRTGRQAGNMCWDIGGNSAQGADAYPASGLYMQQQQQQQQQEQQLMLQDLAGLPDMLSEDVLRLL